MLPSFMYPVIRSHWFQTALGVIVLIVMVWFFGPLLGIGQMHPLDSDIARFIAIAALIVLWIIGNLLRTLSVKRHEKKLEEVVTAPDKDAIASAEEVALLSERLRTAVQALKKAPGGRRERKRLHELPWYMFIGPPGAGKTTALVNSGLNFPLADAKGPAALKGVGGTRNCDWWFTDEAVLIDTAGRYSTQDSQAKVDSAAWLGFLRLLKKHRGGDAQAHPRTARRTGRADAGVCAVHQDRPDGRICRVLRHAGQGGARAGLGHDAAVR